MYNPSAGTFHRPRPNLGRFDRVSADLRPRCETRQSYGRRHEGQRHRRGCRHRRWWACGEAIRQSCHRVCPDAARAIHIMDIVGPIEHLRRVYRNRRSVRKGRLWNDDVARTGSEVVIQKMAGGIPKACDVAESLLEVVITLVFSPSLQAPSILFVAFLLDLSEKHFFFVILRS